MPLPVVEPPPDPKFCMTQLVTVRLPPELKTIPLVPPVTPTPLSDRPRSVTLPLTALIVIAFPPAGGAI